MRWILNEVGWPYEVRLIDTDVQQDAGYRAAQPFGQVPAMIEDGRAPLFETGAIVLDVAMRSGKLLPEDADARAQVLCWYFAALNTIEPALARLADVEFFTADEDDKAKRRPEARKFAEQRLGELAATLGDGAWLVGDAFTVADLMTASVLKIAASLGILEGFESLATYQARIFERDAYREAITDQCAAFAAHSPEDMKYPPEVMKQLAG